MEQESAAPRAIKRLLSILQLAVPPPAADGAAAAHAAEHCWSESLLASGLLEGEVAALLERGPAAASSPPPGAATLRMGAATHMQAPPNAPARAHG